MARGILAGGVRSCRERDPPHPAKYGKLSVGGITSSRCTNEETFLVQKLIRAGFGNNNVDTCARVCHSPTGYGLKTTFGTSAGTQDFDSVMDADVILIIGANPTDGHPVFASRMKRRLRQGARLIVVDPRRIDMVRTPHIEAQHHLPLRPGTQCRGADRDGAHDRHRGAGRRGLHPRALRLGRISALGRVRRQPEELARGPRARHHRRSRDAARRRAALCDRRQRRDLLRPRRDRAQPGLVDRDGDRQPRDGDRQHRPQGRRREPAARPEQRPGRVRHGQLPARAFGLPPHLGR